MRPADQPVSVVMPVRDALPYLDDAVASILAQTHRNFELVIADDASSDGSAERLREWAKRDSRIRLVRNHGPGLGPAGSSNWSARLARHPLIARMDADDVAMPQRLQKQVEAFHDNPEAAMVGTLFESIDCRGKLVWGRDRSIFVDSSSLFPVAHGTIMYRREVFDRIGGYRSCCDYWEDIDFFLRFARAGRVLILPEAHYRYRFASTSSRQVSDERRVAQALDLGLRCMNAYRETGDYEHVLTDAAAVRERVAPPVMLLSTFTRLWSGNPRTILGWTRRHVLLGWDRDSLRALVLAYWAWLSPGSLRAFLRVRREKRDRRAGHAVRDGEPFWWPPLRGDAAALTATTSVAAGTERSHAEPRIASPCGEAA